MIVSMPFMQAFSTAAPGRYVIYLDKDQPITQAMDTIQKEIPDINCIAYGSVKFHLLSHRIIEPLVWIGHGDKEGITTGLEKLSWERFAQEVANSPAADIILSCYSSELQKRNLLPNPNVITFTEEVDATLGGLVAAWLLTGKTNILRQAINHSLSLKSGKTSYEPLFGDALDPGVGGGSSSSSTINLPSSFYILQNLQSYVMCKMSGIELFYHILMFFVLMVQILLAIYINYNQFSFLKTAAAEFFVGGALSLLINFAYYNDGVMTQDELYENLCGVLHDALECFYSAFTTASPEEQAIFLVLAAIAILVTLLEILLDGVSGGACTFLRVAISVSLIFIYIANFTQDLLDEDSVVG